MTAKNFLRGFCLRGKKSEIFFPNCLIRMDRDLPLKSYVFLPVKTDLKM